MLLEISTPDSKVFDDEIVSVTLPGTNGSFQVLKGHAALISTLDDGVVTINQAGNKKLLINVKNGFAEVLNDKIVVLAESAIQA